jgi:uncharacterized membrane protein YcaP (DUF421 family)
MKDILYVIALSLGSVTAIFILTKLMGYRQMSQMSMFDYVNGITIGSIAAEMATSLDENFMQPLTAMIVYSLAAICLSVLSSKSMKARRLIEGTPLVLMDKGELYRDNLKKAKIDVTEFLVQCRISGYFDISKLETAILEGNGKISFLPKSTDRPATPSDLALSPQQDYMVANVILDGNIMEENLKHTGRDEKWLHSQIKAQGAHNIKDVLLATCDTDGKVTVFLKTPRSKTPDVLM